MNRSEGGDIEIGRDATIRFERLMAVSPNPYVLIDRSLVIVWMNDAYLRVTMRKKEDILGKPMFEAFPSDPDSESHRLLDRSFKRVLATGEPDELALIRYDIRKPDGSMEQHYWSATHVPLLDDQGQVSYILQHTVNVTELHNLRRERDEMGLIERAQAVQARNDDLAEESERLRALFEQAPGFVAVLSGPEHRFVLANRAYGTLVGGRDVIGKTVGEALPEVVGQGFVALLDRVYADGAAYIGEREKVELVRQGGDAANARFLDFIYQPILDPSGAVSGILVQGHDVTQEVEAEDRQRLLINELNHRVKNTLSIVQGLAMQSFRRIEGSDEAQHTFNARLGALARAHSLLTSRDWSAGELSEILHNSVEATAGQDSERVHLDGPEVMLPPQLAVSLSMVVHELSTNAIKYGSLSRAGGSVAVSWSITGQQGARRLHIDWVERGGPPVEQPSRRGFGARLIERGLAGDAGRAVLDYAPEGLRCSIELALSDVHE